MIFSISVSLLRFQTSFFFFFFLSKQTWWNRSGQVEVVLLWNKEQQLLELVDSVLGLETEIGVERPRF